MIDNTIFYHSTIRKTVVAFGTIFNNIHVERRDAAGAVQQTLKVPLSYGPKQKFLLRIRQQPDFQTRRIELSVPRLGFEITSLNYDESRAVAPSAQVQYVTSPTSMNKAYAPAPWNIDFALHVYVKNQDDGLQILEQILPFFKPNYDVTLNNMPSLGLKQELPITIGSVTYEDVYEGDYSERTSIIWTLTFKAKMNLFGPVSEAGVIKKVIATVYPNMPGYTVEGDNEKYTAAVDPETAQPTDDYTIIETWENV